MTSLPDIHQLCNTDLQAAVDMQVELAQRVETRDRLPSEVNFVAGVDVAYEKYDAGRIFAAVVVVDVQSLEVVESATQQGTSDFPYVPGFFAFRELAHIVAAYSKLTQTPDLVACDAQGVAHPRRCGLASHFGVMLNVPTIGCGKTRLVGEHVEPGSKRGSFSPLTDRGEIIGNAVRTQNGVKPLYISIGHRVSLQTATDWIVRLAPKYRQPEPIRQANSLANLSRSAATPRGHSDGRG